MRLGFGFWGLISGVWGLNFGVWGFEILTKSGWLAGSKFSRGSGFGVWGLTFLVGGLQNKFEQGKPTCFEQNLKLEKTKFACRTLIANEFWKSELKKLFQKTLEVTFGYAMLSRNQ